MPRVLIIQSQIKRYRVPFFAELNAALACDGIKLHVAYSDPSPEEAIKKDTQELPTEFGIKVPGFSNFGGKLFYQPLLLEIFRADMVIVEQASKHLLNYLLLPLSSFGLKKVAYWGHGRNRQAIEQSLAERVKHLTLNRVDWWFAYSGETALYLSHRGVPASKITNVQNAIDTTELRRQCADVSAEELLHVRQKLNISESAKVGLFCGGIFRERLPEFLIQAARKIRNIVPNFELLIVGDGPAREGMMAAASDAPYIHFVGPQFGPDRAVFFRLSDVFLAPGPMGLAILDSFAAGVPVVTSTAPFHGPEIEYLESGRNGVAVPLEIEEYSTAVARILSNGASLQELKRGANISGGMYTLDNMVARFHSGIIACLKGHLKQIETIHAGIDRPRTAK